MKVFLLLTLTANLCYCQKKLAFIPYFDDKIDEIFYEKVNEIIRPNYSIANDSVLKYNLYNHENINSFINDLIAKTRSGVTVNNIYSGSNIQSDEVFKELMSADIFALPGEIRSRKISKLNGSETIKIEGVIYLFDVHSGNILAKVTSSAQNRSKTKAIEPIDELFKKLLSKALKFL